MTTPAGGTTTVMTWSDCSTLLPSAGADSPSVPQTLRKAAEVRAGAAAARAEFAHQYAAALGHYLAEPDEAALVHAHELGRQALTEGFGVLDIATFHSRAAGAALIAAGTPPDARVVDALQTFFVEALAPFEMAHRGFWEANGVLRRLNDVLEGQVRRIAAALHDDAVQLLASVHLALADVASTLPDERARDIAEARRMLDQIEVRLRNLAHELRPPILEDLGLVPALEFLADGFSRRWGIPVTVHTSIPGDLPPIVETTIYRVVQEALTNVARHARATEAHVSVWQAALQIACSVRDDGVGFDASALEPGAKRGIGLFEIQERVAALGGVLRVGSNVPRGTDLTVEIPLEH
jgi:signal transduction histidine kinase